MHGTSPPSLPPLAASRHSSSIFDGLQQWELPQIAAKLPLFIPDFGSITLVYSASTRGVAALLPHPDMRPIEVLPGRCLLVVAALDYRESDLGAYHEFVVALPVSVGRHLPAVAAALKDALAGTASAYIWQMPVTTPRSCEAGRGIAGFPKFVADIGFERRGEQLVCNVVHEGQHLARLACRVEPGGGQRTLQARSYTLREGRPLVTQMRVHQQQAVEHLHGRAGSLELGAHPVAATLRALELSARPLASQYCPVAQAVLFFPRQLGEP